MTLPPPVSLIDHFAEYLSQGLTVNQAGARLGWSQDYANAQMQRLRKRLGPQAV